MKKTTFAFSILFASVGMSLAVLAGVGNNIKMQSAEAVGNYSTDASTYYSGITATSGQALLGELHDLTCQQHKYYSTYTDCKTPEYVYATDPGDSSSYVRDFYSQNGSFLDKSWGAGATGTWNREHVWCQSLSSGLWGETGGGGDLHHLRPLECTENSTRNNHPFGIVSDHSSSTAKYPKDTSKNYVTTSVGGYYATGTDCWEPNDASKGDTARILMYVYMHYNTYSNVSGTTDGSGSSSYFGTLSITNVVTTEAGTADAAWALLLQWNTADPVNDLERTRNEACAKYQGNRNPFIDHPEYANAIWGNGEIIPGETPPSTGDSSVVYQFDATSTSIATSSTYNSYSGTAASSNSSSTVSTATWAINCGNKQTSGEQWLGSNSKQSAKLALSNGSFSEASGIASAMGISADDTYTTAMIGRTAFEGVNKVTLALTGTGGTAPANMWLLSSSDSGSTWSTVETCAFATSKTFEFNTINSAVYAITFKGTAYHQIKGMVLTFYSEQTTVYVDGVTVSPSTVSLVQGETSTLSATVSPSNATNTAVTWESNNEDIATVTSDGVVTAVHPGTCQVAATTSDGGYSDSCTVTVTSNGVTPASINYTSRKTSFNSGDLFSIGTGTLKVTFSDSTTETVTLSSTGVAVLYGTEAWDLSTPLTATHNGQDFYITYTKDGTTVKTTKITITVITLVTSISFNKTSVTLDPGATETLTPTVLPANASDTTFSWASSNSGVATASGNVITAVAAGSATLTATANDGSGVKATVTVTVNGTATYTDYQDVLVKSDTGASSSYIDWSGVTKSSSAVYAGNSGGGNESIQLRTTNSNSGVVTTTSGGKITKIVVVWNTATTAGRILQIYGSNSAYSAASDLYTSGTAGTLLGTLTYTSATSNETTLEISDSYKYVGIKSKSSALYLTSIEFDWRVTSEVQDDVTISQGDAQTLAHPNTLQLTTTTTGTGSATSGVVTYSSSNIWVATVSSTGLVTTVGGGKTVVSATFGDAVAKITITVTESWTEISQEKTTTTSGYEKAMSLSVGDVVYLVSQNASRELSGFSTTSTVYGISTSYTDTPAYSYPLTVCAGSSTGTYAFKNSSNSYLYWTSGNSLNVNSTLDAKTSWTVTFDSSGNATILNCSDSARQICCNNASSSERFACYTGKTLKDDTAYPCIQLMTYKSSGSTETIVYNDVSDDNSAALNFAHQVLSTLGEVCKYDGTTVSSELTTAWNSLFTSSNSYYAALNSTSKLMLKYATSDASGDTFQKLASLYDLVVAKYGLADHLERNAASSSNHYLKVNNGNTALLVISTILSLSALAAAGVVYLKRKQED